MLVAVDMHLRGGARLTFWSGIVGGRCTILTVQVGLGAHAGLVAGCYVHYEVLWLGHRIRQADVNSGY
jgi:hypothetical protein